MIVLRKMFFKSVPDIVKFIKTGPMVKLHVYIFRCPNALQMESTV